MFDITDCVEIRSPEHNARVQKYLAWLAENYPDLLSPYAALAPEDPLTYVVVEEENREYGYHELTFTNVRGSFRKKDDALRLLESLAATPLHYDRRYVMHTMDGPTVLNSIERIASRKED